MNSRKGFAYTTFALLSATLLISLTFTQVYKPASIQTANAERIGQASFFMNSIFSDMDRSLSIATRRSFTGANNYVVTEGEPLSSPKDNVSEVLVNGTLDGEELDSVGNASLSEWASRVSKIGERSGYRLNIVVRNYSFESRAFGIDSSFKVFARLKDPTTLAAFNRTRSAQASASIEGLEDPMITLRSKGRYVTNIQDCGFSDPADQVLTGSQNSSTSAHGQVVLRPSDISPVNDSAEKIVAVEDPDSYSSSELNGFDGVVGAQEHSSPGDITTTYVFGTGSLDGLEDEGYAIIDNEDVWRTRFVPMFDQGCYIPSERGPNFLDRLGNELVSDSGGITTLIDVSELPQELQKTESSVAFVYFNESGSYGSTERVEGISDDYSWFRLDSYHVDEWGLNELVE